MPSPFVSLDPVPVPPFAVHVGIIRTSLAYDLVTGNQGFIAQLDAANNVVRADVWQTLTASTLSNALFWCPLHPSAVNVQLWLIENVLEETQAVIFGLDLGGA